MIRGSEGKAKMTDDQPTSSSVLGKLSRTLHSAEEKVIHSVQGVAEGLKHGTEQLLHGGREEVGGMVQGVRAANETLPHSIHGTGSMSGASVRSVKEKVSETMDPKAGGYGGEKMGHTKDELTKPVSEKIGEAAERGREAIERSQMAKEASRLDREALRLAGVVETGQGDVLSPGDFLVNKAARGVRDEAKEKAWTKGHDIGQQVR